MINTSHFANLKKIEFYSKRRCVKNDKKRIKSGDFRIGATEQSTSSCFAYALPVWCIRGGVLGLSQSAVDTIAIGLGLFGEGLIKGIIDMINAPDDPEDNQTNLDTFCPDGLCGGGGNASGPGTASGDPGGGNDPSGEGF